MSLPNWPGAKHCYREAAILLGQWNAEAYRAQRAAYKRKTGFRYVPPDISIELIAALGAGDEERIKGLLLQHATTAFNATRKP